MKKISVAALCVLSLSACTTVNVQKVDTAAHKIEQVCIIENPKVAVSDFLQVLESGFQRHGIQTSVQRGRVPESCEYTLTYTAKRGWDLKPFLNMAELSLKKGNTNIASAVYSHGGGFALNKWAGTKEKIDPVIDQLLSGS